MSIHRAISGLKPTFIAREEKVFSSKSVQYRQKAGHILAVFFTLPFFLQLSAFQNPFYFSSQYDESVPTPKQILGFELGSRPTRFHEAIGYLKVLSEKSPLVHMASNGKTHEGRKLHFLLISSQENMDRLDDVKRDLSRLGDPRKTNTAQAEKIVKKTPAVAWMFYSIHGDELSGTDAALAVAYRLAAGTDDQTRKLRNELVIGIYPMENPDGRERYLAQMQQWGGRIASHDRQSLQHTGVWPWGRTNHYFFDLNRDWFILSQPESRSRMQLVVDWNPQLVADAHEMGSNSTFLFNPPREPINHHMDLKIQQWWKVFAKDQAAAFDKHGWRYYTGEWYEDWYPGYGSSYPALRGAVGILYEQASTDGSAVKQTSGYLSTFEDAVNHQFTSSLANLTTAANNRQALLQDFYNLRKKGVDAKNKDGVSAYILSSPQNPTRVERLVEKLLLQKIEVFRANDSFSLNGIKSFTAFSTSRKSFAKGTYIIPVNQPLRPVINAILELDPRMSTEVLRKERESLEKGRGTEMYEVSAWSMPLAYDVAVYAVQNTPSVKMAKVDSIVKTPGMLVKPDAGFGYLLPYFDDNAVDALLHFFNNDWRVRSATKPFKIEGRMYDRGTLLLIREENPAMKSTDVQRCADKAGVTIYGVNTALSEEKPDLGGGQFKLLHKPRIAMLAGPDVSSYNVGTLRFLLDYELGISVSLLNSNNFSRFDLRPYNVLVLPSSARSFAKIFDKKMQQAVKTWVQEGGTLVAIGNSAVTLADTTTGLSAVKLRRQILKELPDYEKALQQERYRNKIQLDSLAVWAGKSIPGFDPGKTKAEKQDMAALKEIDARQRLFMPRGAILNVLLDEEHWLNFGLGKQVPAIIYSDDAFMSKSPVQTAARLASAKELRLSGLLWPEARERWQNTAYATREASGKGQIILFAGEPNFRSYFYGTARMFVNSVLLGPGMGTRQPAPW
ncbi:MAG: hypothetical protein DWQ10_01490 [Calditrichaeota bacterium]|nr:MAG: hypothetical protein DWQ10_01490 [Calditrichota bacterium]